MTWYKPWTWGQAAYQGGALTNADIGIQEARPAPTRSASNISVTDERAMMVSTVFACTRLISQTCATLPLGFYERRPDGREPLDERHYLNQLLKYKPNNFMTGLELRQSIFVSLTLWGNSYCLIKWSGNRPISLTPLKPEYMEVQRGSDGLVYKYSRESGVVEYSSREILHVKNFSTDGIVGVSPLGYARETLGLTIASDQSASKSALGLAKAVLELDEWPTDEQKQRLREYYGQQGSVEFSDNLAIIPGGMKYRGVSINPDDMQLLESRQFQVPEICRFFGVPSVLVDGQAGSTASWPASYEQQMLSFTTFTLRPYLKEVESAIVSRLANNNPNIIVEHNVNGLLRADSAGRATFYSAALQNGWMTRAEVRQKENLPFIEGSDTLTVQVNMTNLEDLPEVSNAEQTPDTP